MQVEKKMQKQKKKELVLQVCQVFLLFCPPPVSRFLDEVTEAEGPGSVSGRMETSPVGLDRVFICCAAAAVLMTLTGQSVKTGCTRTDLKGNVSLGDPSLCGPI